MKHIASCKSNFCNFTHFWIQNWHLIRIAGKSLSPIIFNGKMQPVQNRVNGANSRSSKVRNVFVLRKGNSTRDSNIPKQNSSESINNNVYGLERQTSINSLNDSDWAGHDNSLSNKRQLYNPKHASSNGFQMSNKNGFEPYSQNGSFKTPRQKPGVQLASIDKQCVKRVCLIGCYGLFELIWIVFRGLTTRIAYKTAVRSQMNWQKLTINYQISLTGISKLGL